MNAKAKSNNKLVPISHIIMNTSINIELSFSSGLKDVNCKFIDYNQTHPTKSHILLSRLVEHKSKMNLCDFWH